MKSFWLACTLMILLIGITFFQLRYITNFTDHMSALCDTLDLSPDSETRLQAMEDYWASHRTIISISVGDRERDDLTYALRLIRIAYASQDASEFEKSRAYLSNAIESLSRLESFSVENLF